MRKNLTILANIQFIYNKKSPFSFLNRDYITDYKLTNLSCLFLYQKLLIVNPK